MVAEKKSSTPLICGVVMPISSIDGCDESHWSDVLEIISEAVEIGGFQANLVSNADDVGVIHKRIIQNLYENPMVVCDVSGRNPNVMFELGMRLAFDKPTLIIKDDKTSFSFDTSSIEHLEYPRDLRFSKIVDFKERLSEKLKRTYDKSVTDPSYTTFLKHFGEFKVAKIEQKEVTGQEFILDELQNLRFAIARLNRDDTRTDVRRIGKKGVCLRNRSVAAAKRLVARFAEDPEFLEIAVRPFGNHQHLFFQLMEPEDERDFLEYVEKQLPKKVVPHKKTSTERK